MNVFRRFARRAADLLGSPVAFAITAGVIALWVIGGLLFGFSDTYQLWINTISTLATSIYVVLIQASQNHDGAALHAKIDSLIGAVEQADDRLIGIERRTDEEAKP